MKLTLDHTVNGPLFRQLQISDDRMDEICDQKMADHIDSWKENGLSKSEIIEKIAEWCHTPEELVGALDFWYSFTCSVYGKV